MNRATDRGAKGVEILIVVVGLAALAGGAFWMAQWWGGCRNQPDSATPALSETPPPPPNPWPVGMKTRTTVAVEVTGEAVSARKALLLTWDHRKQVTWLCTIEFETTVLSNNGQILNLQRRFTDVRQSFVAQELGTHIGIESVPFIDFVAARIWDSVSPEVRLSAKALRELYRQLDPEGRLMVDALDRLSEKMGVKINPENAQQLLDTDKFLRALEGLTVQMTSVDGVGNLLGKIDWSRSDEPELQEAEQLSDTDRNRLKRWLERNATMLLRMDLLDQARSAQVGQRLEFRAGDLGIPLDVFGSGIMSGEIIITADVPSADVRPGMKYFSFSSGRMDYRSDSGRTGASGSFDPIRGELIFDPQRLLFDHLLLIGTGEYRFSEDHWLVDVEFRGEPSIMVRISTVPIQPTP